MHLQSKKAVEVIFLEEYTTISDGLKHKFKDPLQETGGKSKSLSWVKNCPKETLFTVKASKREQIQLTKQEALRIRMF